MIHDNARPSSIRVPAQCNPYAGQFCESGGLRLPVATTDALYLPRIAMKALVETAGYTFPCRYSERLRGRVDIHVSAEGFLVRSARLTEKQLHTLQSRLLERFGAYTVAYDFIRPADALAGDDEDDVPYLLRLLPWSIRPAGEAASGPSTHWHSFNARNDMQMLSYVNDKRPAGASPFAVEALRQAIPLAGAADLPRPVPPASEAPTCHLCNPADMSKRIEREPSRNQGSGGSLPTLTRLCEEKHLLPASQSQVEALAALHARLPNFSPVIAYLERKLEAQRLCGNPVRIPPVLLVGPPGVGKSYFGRMLTQALSLPFECVSVAGSSQELHITGLSKGWGSAGPSRFAEILAGSPVANPLIMVDEIDKASEIKVQNALLQLFEAETAARWVDQYVEIPLDLSRVLFIATANDAQALSPVLLSRFEVFTIAPPGEAELASVYNSIYADEKARFSGTPVFSECLSPAVLACLIGAAQTPREARRRLINAMELAIIRTHRQLGRLKKGCVALQAEDLPAVRHDEALGRIGFI